MKYQGSEPKNRSTRLENVGQNPEQRELKSPFVEVRQKEIRPGHLYERKEFVARLVKPSDSDQDQPLRLVGPEWVQEAVSRHPWQKVWEEKDQQHNGLWVTPEFLKRRAQPVEYTWGDEQNKKIFFSHQLLPKDFISNVWLEIFGEDEAFAQVPSSYEENDYLADIRSITEDKRPEWWWTPARARNEVVRVISRLKTNLTIIATRSVTPSKFQSSLPPELTAAYDIYDQRMKKIKGAQIESLVHLITSVFPEIKFNVAITLPSRTAAVDRKPVDHTERLQQSLIDLQNPLLKILISSRTGESRSESRDGRIDVTEITTTSYNLYLDDRLVANWSTGGAYTRTLSPEEQQVDEEVKRAIADYNRIPNFNTVGRNQAADQIKEALRHLHTVFYRQNLRKEMGEESFLRWEQMTFQAGVAEQKRQQGAREYQQVDEIKEIQTQVQAWQSIITEAETIVNRLRHVQSYVASKQELAEARKQLEREGALLQDEWFVQDKAKNLRIRQINKAIAEGKIYLAEAKLIPDVKQINYDDQSIPDKQRVAALAIIRSEAIHLHFKKLSDLTRMIENQLSPQKPAAIQSEEEPSGEVSLKDLLNKFKKPGK